MYPVDRRHIACHMYPILGSMRKVALLLAVSTSTIHRWLHQPERKRYFRPSVKSQAVLPVIRACVEADPLITLQQLAFRIRQALDITVSKELLRTVLSKNGYTRKRARFYGQPVDLPGKTTAFLAQRCRFIQEGRLFASVDETSFGRNSYGACIMGYGQRGVPLRLPRRPARTTTISVLAAAGSDGCFSYCSRAGSFNGKTFAQFLRQLALPPQTVLLLDNVRFHHSSESRAAAAEKGFELLFVPPYSPWFNPVETVFSVIKRHYYLHHDPEAALAIVRPSHVLGAFRHSFASTNAGLHDIKNTATCCL